MKQPVKQQRRKGAKGAASRVKQPSNQGTKGKMVSVDRLIAIRGKYQAVQTSFGRLAKSRAEVCHRLKERAIIVQEFELAGNLLAAARQFERVAAQHSAHSVFSVKKDAV